MTTAKQTQPAAAPAQAPQAPDTTTAKQIQETATAQPAAASQQPADTTTAKQTQPATEAPTAPIVREVGYRVGMAAPEFGMTLADGSELTSAMLVDEGKPVLLYFHSTT